MHSKVTIVVWKAAARRSRGFPDLETDIVGRVFLERGGQEGVRLVGQ